MKKALSIVFLFSFALLASCASEQQPAGGAAATTTVLVVRHTEKASEADDSPLSEAGVRRAEALARAAEASGVSAIYITQFRRSLDTARPLSERLGVPVTQAPVQNLQDPGDYGRKLARQIVEKHRGQTVLVVGHSNTVPSVVEELTGRAGAAGQVEYGDLFVVTVPPEGPTRLVRAQFGFAPAR
jgi:broad specificity phosphatase PhoE